MDNHHRESDIGKQRTGKRSTDPHDYQSLPVTLAVMPKRFPDGHVIATHHHLRDQLIYAVAGLMRVRTTAGTWVVPPDRALYMPAGVRHGIEICGDVEMRTLYITPAGQAQIKVLTVSALLRELIVGLACEPMDYSDSPRARQMAALIMTELAAAEALPLNIPLPADARLQRVCRRLLQDPSTSLTLEQMADEAGASSRTLARLFVRELGMGFSAWRRRVRFSKALELLGRGQPMKQVAAACGYDNPSAFSHAFRSAFGLPPTVFRAG